MNLKHQTQPTSDTCVSTCIAMILNEPVNRIVDEFHDEYINHKIQVDEYLHRKNIKCKPLLAISSDFLHGRFYMLAVPSLNIPALMHAIVVYYDNDDRIILDPNKGKPGKKYYVDEETDNENEFELVSYCFEYEIIL